MIDTHAHIYTDAFDNDIDEVIRDAKMSGIKAIMMPDIDEGTTSAMLKLSSKYEGFCYPMIGVHPCSVHENINREVNRIERLLNEIAFFGIGETGIDLYWDKNTFDLQKQFFSFQIDLAIDTGLPLIIHSRDSLEVTIRMVGNKQKGRLKGVFHCFTGDMEQAKMIMDMGFYMGIGGVVSFKNSGLKEVVENIPLESMLLETDAPYLAPHPYRGKRNKPSYLGVIANAIAEAKATLPEEVGHTTTRNAVELFGIAEAIDEIF